MMGMAAGLALSGLRPFTYTITPFVTTRCLEQIRIDVCYHDVPVMIVAVGAGLSYARSARRTTPARTSPSALACRTWRCSARAMHSRCAPRCRPRCSTDRPVYIRLGKKGEPAVHHEAPSRTSRSARP